MHTTAPTATSSPAAPTVLPPGIEIFKAGQCVADDGTHYVFSEGDVADMAASYDPALREAPLCIGHPADNLPAWGWVKSLSAQSGRLAMDTKDVRPQFAELVATKQYKKRSSSFYPPTHPNNPTPGRWYLRHVAFLGAQQPAVAGLADFSEQPEVGVVSFAEGDGGAEIPPHSPTESSMTTETHQAASAVPPTPAATPDVNAQLQAAQESAAAAQRERDQALAQLASFAEARKAARLAEFTSFAEGLARKAILKPAETALAVAALQALDGCAPVEFAEGNTVRKDSVLDWLKGRLEAAQPLVSFGEHAPGSVPGAADAVDIKAIDDAAFDRMVRAHMRQHRVASYAEAAQAIAASTFTS